MASSWATATVWRGEGKVDVLLGVEANDERRDVDNLFADAAHTWMLAAGRRAVLTLRSEVRGKLTECVFGG